MKPAVPHNVLCRLWLQLLTYMPWIPATSVSHLKTTTTEKKTIESLETKAKDYSWWAVPVSR